MLFFLKNPHSKLYESTMGVLGSLLNHKIRNSTRQDCPHFSRHAVLHESQANCHNNQLLANAMHTSPLFTVLRGAEVQESISFLEFSWQFSKESRHEFPLFFQALRVKSKHTGKSFYLNVVGSVFTFFEKAVHKGIARQFGHVRCSNIDVVCHNYSS